MQINSVSLNNSPSFGIKCKPEIAQKLAKCLTKKGEKVSFSNGEFLAKNISSIGSQATELIGVEFVKARKASLFTNEIPNDLCILKFQLTAPDGEFKTLETSISSIRKLCKRVHNKFKKNKPTQPTILSTDLFKQFQETLKQVERGFIKNSIIESMKDGNAKTTASKLAEIYPTYKGFILDFAASVKKIKPENNVQNVENTSMIKKLFKKIFSK